MDLLTAIILGIIQGLTEFLPVSSSGHLEIGKALLGDDSIPADSLLFTVVVHAATALSTLAVFRKEVAKIISGLLQFKINESSMFSLKILLSMVPALIVGLFFEEYVARLFGGNLLLVGIMLIVTAFLLFLADRARNEGKNTGFGDAFLIGVAQAVAMLPGISRSGATISTSVLLGIEKTQAARFSFLMVVPLILGSMVREIGRGNLNAGQENILPMAAGFFAAFISGFMACTLMIKLVQNSRLTYFAIYCVLIGLCAIIYSLI